MAITNPVYSKVALPAFSGPTRSLPTVSPPDTVGGGVTLDPSGLVPINRSQPTTTDPQQVAANRMAMMPPAAFSTAGVVPLSATGSPAAALRTADIQTMAGPAVVPTGKPASPSTDAAAAVAQANSYPPRAGGQGIPPALANIAPNIPPGLAKMIPPGLDTTGMSVRDIVKSITDYRRAQAQPVPRTPTYSEQVRARFAGLPQEVRDRLLANPQLAQRFPGLLGLAG